MIQVNNKRRKQPMEQKQVDAPIEQSQVAEPVSRRFVPNDCSMCEERRPKNKSYSYVYWTRERVRYCKCKFCGHTWKEGKE